MKEIIIMGSDTNKDTLPDEPNSPHGKPASTEWTTDTYYTTTTVGLALQVPELLSTSEAQIGVFEDGDIPHHFVSFPDRDGAMQQWLVVGFFKDASGNNRVTLQRNDSSGLVLLASVTAEQYLLSREA